MRQKQIKKLRKNMNLKISSRKGYKPDYRILQEKDVLAYFDGYDTVNGVRVPNGEKIAKSCKRRVIINTKKLSYRRIKKDFQRLLKHKPIHFSKENSHETKE